MRWKGGGDEWLKKMVSKRTTSKNPERRNLENLILLLLLLSHIFISLKLVFQLFCCVIAHFFHTFCIVYFLYYFTLFSVLYFYFIFFLLYRMYFVVVNCCATELYKQKLMTLVNFEITSHKQQTQVWVLALTEIDWQIYMLCVV